MPRSRASVSGAGLRILNVKKTAVMLDIGFLQHKLRRGLKRYPTAADVRNFATICLSQDEELFRIYCYHCPPYSGTEIHPMTGAHVDFAATQGYSRMQRFIRELKILDGVAVREGELSFDGWIIKRQAVDEIVITNRAIQPDDFQPDIKQKAVDMKIGLDVAWLAGKSIVDRIILVTGDSDMIPAMKFARREGVQVILINLGHNIKRELREHADEFRQISYP